jgi:hypothetical protein
MPYEVKRIILKSGELITERDPQRDATVFDGPIPIVGDIITATYRGRRFSAKVIWGNWLDRPHADDVVVPLRVQEV